MMTVGLASIFGLVVGSFVNVVAHRVPRGESIVTPRSRCPGCSTEIRAIDNIPVLSWLFLKRRCRSCAAPISWRYPATELATGAAFGFATVRFGAVPVLGAYLVLFAALVAITSTDLELRVIPKRIVWPAYGIVLSVLGAAAALDADGSLLVRAIAASAAAFALLFVIHFISPRGMGFGDVRLAALLGLGLGWLGWGHVALGLFLGFFFGGLGGVVALLAGRSRRSAMPFGPFLALGTAVAVLVGQPIIDWYVRTLL